MLAHLRLLQALTGLLLFETIARVSRPGFYGGLAVEVARRVVDAVPVGGSEIAVDVEAGGGFSGGLLCSWVEEVVVVELVLREVVVDDPSDALDVGLRLVLALSTDGNVLHVIDDLLGLFDVIVVQ